MRLSEIWDLLKQTIAEWQEDKAARLGASLAYYAIFSMAPLLVILVAVVGLFYHGDTVGQLRAQFTSLVGPEAAQLLADAIDTTNDSVGGGVMASVIGVVTLLLGASGVFGELQDAMNTIWEVQPRPGRGWLGMIKDRFLSFTMVLGVGFLLLISLVVSAGLAAVSTYFQDLLPGSEILWQILNIVLSFGVTTLLFAMIYKILPDVEIAWRDVWVGAAVTALLFTIGKSLIGFYLGQGTVGSAYGAAGTLMVLLVWIYYSAQILFLGAEFTQVYANKYGKHVVASKNAVPMTEEARAQQGIPRPEHVAAMARGKPSGQPTKPASAVHPVPPTSLRGQVPPERPKTLTPGSALVGVAGLLVGYLVGNLRSAARRFR